MNKKTAPAAIPSLTASPFASAEPADHQKLSAADRDFLGKQESIIAAGQKTFLAVGAALIEIRDYKDGALYERYGGWEAYCRERWGFGQSQAYRLVGAAEVVKVLSPIGEKMKSPLPLNENQTRPLMQLKLPQDQQKAWKSVVKKAEGGEITGVLVSAVVRELIEDGAERTQRERKTVKTSPTARKLDGKILNVIRAKLRGIRKAAAGNKAITTLVSDIEAFLDA